MPGAHPSCVSADIPSVPMQTPSLGTPLARNIDDAGVPAGTSPSRGGCHRNLNTASPGVESRVSGQDAFPRRSTRPSRPPKRYAEEI